MDPVTAAVAILHSLNWSEIWKKFATDSASEVGKYGRTSLLRRLQPDEQQKVATKAIELFTEEFLKELEDKSPLSAALPGYHDQLKRLLESAAIDIASHFEPDIKKIDLAPVERMWPGDPLPEDFDWSFLAQQYERRVRRQFKKDPDLSRQYAIALQEDSHAFEHRHDPGWNLAAYRDFLQKKCALLQLSAMHASAYDRRVTLWSVFVPQSAREAAPVREIPREVLRQLRREGHATNGDDEEQIARLKDTFQNSPVSNVLELIGRERLVVLLGDPGSGKTSLLKYLVLRWASAGQVPLPLWIDLKEYARQASGLKLYLESGAAAFGLSAQEIETELQAGRAALFLDGLDEIFDIAKRASVIEQVAAFAARYSAASVVVTSRIIGYEPERLRHAGFTHATLEDFDDAQLSAFVEKWHAIAEEDPKERIRLQAQLQRAVAGSRAIRELAGNPLLLTMMAILNRNQELPRDRVELYREASRVLLHEWDASRALLPSDTFARQEKEALLRQLAGAMQQAEGGLAGNLIERDALVQILRSFLTSLGIENPHHKAQALIHQLTERNFILCFAGADRFSFVHRTFLEYFCAAWFVEQFEKQRTLSLDQLKIDVFGKHWHDENWHEVLRLIAGMVGEKQAEELVLSLLATDGRAHRLANLILAAGCLSEIRNRQAIRATDELVLRQLLEQGVTYEPPYHYELWEKNREVGPTRRKAVAAIAAVWPTANTRAWLLSAVGSSEDEIVRMAAVRELARGWKHDADTLPWLKDRTCADESMDVRMAAVEELARGWKNDPDTVPLLKDYARADEDAFVRWTTLDELARGWKDDPDTLLFLKDRARADKHIHVRSLILQELARGWKDGPDTLPFLKDRVGVDEDGYVRSVALRELTRGWKDDPDTLLFLKDRARADQSPAVRTAALRELARGWKDDADTLPFLKDRALVDEDDDVRSVALEELTSNWKDDPEVLALIPGIQ
jgi:hypothetical protein